MASSVAGAVSRGAVYNVGVGGQPRGHGAGGRYARRPAEQLVGLPRCPHTVTHPTAAVRVGSTTAAAIAGATDDNRGMGRGCSHRFATSTDHVPWVSLLSTFFHKSHKSSHPPTSSLSFPRSPLSRHAALPPNPSALSTVAAHNGSREGLRRRHGAFGVSKSRGPWGPRGGRGGSARPVQEAGTPGPRCRPHPPPPRCPGRRRRRAG